MGSDLIKYLFRLLSGMFQPPYFACVNSLEGRFDALPLNTGQTGRRPGYGLLLHGIHARQATHSRLIQLNRTFAFFSSCSLIIAARRSSRRFLKYIGSISPVMFSGLFHLLLVALQETRFNGKIYPFIRNQPSSLLRGLRAASGRDNKYV